MSYTVAGSAGRPRPGVVSGSTWLLYLVAGLVLGYAAISVVTYLAIRDITPDLATADEREAYQLVQTISYAVQWVLYVLVAVGFLVLGVFNGRGKQPARIVTWVMSGIVALGCACGLVGEAVGQQLVGALDAEDIMDQVNAALPGWVTPATIIVSAAIVVLLIVVTILLALPAANDYFRKEQQVWLPPTT